MATSTINFPVTDLGNGSDTLQLILVFTTTGTNETLTAADEGIHVVRYGDLVWEYKLDDPLLVPGTMDFSISDNEGTLKGYLFPGFGVDSIDPRALVTLKLNGVDEFIGTIIESSVVWDEGSKLIQFEAAPQTDILNRTMVYDLDDDPQADTLFSYTGDDDEAIGFTTLLEDMFGLVDATLAYNSNPDLSDIIVLHKWRFKGYNVSDSYKAGATVVGRFLVDLFLWTKRMFFDTTVGISNVGDVLKRLAFDFGAFTGMIHNGKAFFKQLFEYHIGYTQTIAAGDILEHKKQYRFNLIDYVRITTEKRQAPGDPETSIVYEAGVETNLEGRFFDEKSLTFRDGWITQTNPTPPPYFYLSSLRFVESGAVQYNAYESRAGGVGGGLYQDNGQTLADLWLNFRGDITRCSTDWFLLNGVGYDFLKDFIVDNVLHQPVKMRKSFESGTTEIEALNLGSLGALADVDEDVVAYWVPSIDADEYNAGDTGKTLILDRSGRGNHLTMTNIADIDAFLNNNYPRTDFDGTNDVGLIPAGEYEDFEFDDDDFSIDIWFKRDTSANDDGILGCSNGSVRRFYVRVDSADTCVFAIQDDDTAAATYNGNIAADLTTVDYCLSCVRDGQTLRMYLNGVAMLTHPLGASVYNLINFTLASFNVGNIGNQTAGNEFDGSINAVRISTVARTEAEHNDFYQNSYFAQKIA